MQLEQEGLAIAKKVEANLSHCGNNAVQALVVREEAIGDHELRLCWQPCTVQSNISLHCIEVWSVGLL